MSIYHEFKTHGIEVLDNKYFKWYCQLVDRRIECPSPDDYVERHHWIPKSLHSNNDLVVLSAREHFISHLLLVRFLTGIHRSKMLCALGSMMKHKNVVSAKTYELTKIAFGKHQSSLANTGIAGYKGEYITPWGSFLSSKTAVDACPVGMCNNTITRYCVDRIDVALTRQMIGQSIYLRSLDFDPFGMTPRDIGFSFIEHDKEIKRIKNGPGDGTCRGIKRWRKEEDVVCDYECPGDGWINIGIRGVDHHNSGGLYCHKDYGCFGSGNTLAEASGINRGVIHKHKKNGYRTIITKRAICQSPYLKSLSFDPEGMTWSDLGLSYKEKEDTR
jgi:hypothetical protein